MSSRYPPNASENRYPRERSPPRSLDRRPVAAYTENSLASRVSDPDFRSNDSSARHEQPREPPRGPKALIDGARGGYGRGRGIGGRGDIRDRDFRDSRDEPFGRKVRGQDWAARDRFDVRDRERSRSPFSRGSRDGREALSRVVAPTLRERTSAEAPLSSAGSPVPESFSSRGRGNSRGRGRGGRQNDRGRSFQGGERDVARPRSPSRDRDWEKQLREDNELDRERELEDSRRDEEYRKEREARDRDDRSRRDQASSRPDRPNAMSSGGVLRTPFTPRSGSATSLQKLNQDRFSQNHQDRAADPNRRAQGPDVSQDVITSRDHNRPEPLGKRVEEDRHTSRPSSPPQAPPVPAFGSIPQRTPNATQETPVKPSAPKAASPSIHPSRVSLVDPAKEAPSAPKAHLLSKAPTAPKAQQSQLSTMRSGSRESAFEPTRNWGSRFPTNIVDPDASVSRSSLSGASAHVPRSSSATQPSVRKAVEEQGRNGNAPPTNHSVPNPKMPGDPSIQASAMRIPTGPRAERAVPSIRQPAPPSIRGPANRPPPMMQRVPPRQPSTWSWIKPGLAQGLKTGPPTGPRGPSIMNTAPTKRDFVGEDKSRFAFNTESTSSAAVSSKRTIASPTRSPSADVNVKVVDDNESRGGDSLEETSMSRQGSLHELKLKMLPTGPSKGNESDEGENEDADMDLDEKDFHDAERKFEREMRALEIKRPPSPRSHPVLLELLEELDALASALEEKVEDGSTFAQLRVDPSPTGLPSPPKLEDVDEMEVKSAPRSPTLPVRLRRPTPPVDSLPFLNTGPLSPFSEIEELQQDVLQKEAIQDLITKALVEERDRTMTEYDDARHIYTKLYTPWRMQVEDFEDERRLQDAQEAIPLESVAVPSAPATVGRRGKIASESEFDAVLEASKETYAIENKARREQGPPVYIPVETFVPEREAVIPEMLSKLERKCSTFVDNNNYVEPDEAFNALDYVPKVDDFTEGEHKKFLETYVMFPKKFGIIAEYLESRTYQDCVQHYYATKRKIRYKNEESAFLRTKKGRKLLRGPQVRPNSNFLGTNFDGAMEYEAQVIALNEKGRPKRAAAPTFGDNGDPELGASAITPAKQRGAASKETNTGNLSSDKTAGKRTRTASTKEKPGRKPKNQLLAAAPAPSPAPSPSKENPQHLRALSKEPTLDLGSHQEDFEGAQLLAGLQGSGQTYQIPVNQGEYIQSWVAAQPPVNEPPLVQETLAPPLPKMGQSQPTQQRSGTVPTTSSYWSVPEQTDFRNYVRYFGTDWQAIANTMKTKTHTMIKNYYTREIGKGEEGKDLEAGARVANEKRSLGEDMGPLPRPTTVPPKRRYDAASSREIHRPLAPSIESSEMGNKSPYIRPAKSQRSPPNFSNAPPRFSASAQAEQGAAALSSQMLSQGPLSPANRITIQPQQKPPQPSNGPRLGVFGERDTRPPSHAPTESAPHSQHQTQAQSQQQQELQQASVNQQFLEQQQEMQQQHAQRRLLQQIDREDQSRHRHDQRHGLLQSDVDMKHEQYQQQRANRMSSLSSFDLAQNQQPPSNPDARTGPPQQIEFDEASRRAFEQRMMQKEEEERRNLQRRQPNDTAPTMPRSISGAFELPRRLQHTSAQSSAASNILISPVKEQTRPNSVPATAAIQPTPPQPPKKSSIMNLLNDEPAEPKPSKRMSDPRAAVATPPPQLGSGTSQPYQQGNQSLQQQIHRRSTPTESLQHLKLHQKPFLVQQSQQQQQQSQAREAVRDWTSGLQQRPSFFEQRPSFQTQPVPSPHPQQSFLPLSSSRSAFQALHQEHGPSPPPPFSHSRTSSYTSMSQPQAPHQQQQQQTHPHLQEHRASMPSTPAETTLRPSPYAKLNPPPPPPSNPFQMQSERDREREIQQQQHQQRIQLHQQHQQAHQQHLQALAQQSHSSNNPLHHHHRPSNAPPSETDTRLQEEQLRLRSEDLQRQQFEAQKQQEQYQDRVRRHEQEQYSRQRHEQEQQQQTNRRLLENQEKERREMGGGGGGDGGLAAATGRKYTPFYSSSGEGGYAKPGGGSQRPPDRR